jgi:hypothetical protein
MLLWTVPVLAQDEPTPPDPVVTGEEPAPQEPAPEEPAAQDPEPGEETPDATNPPPYMVDLIENSELTPEMAEQMRTSGMGWGEIRIATSLAEQMVANSPDPDNPLLFDDALAHVLNARADGMGYGEIAQQNDLKVGQLVRNRNRVQEPLEGDGLATEEGLQAGEAVQTRGKKRGLFARLAGFLGFGKAKRPEEPAKPEEPGSAEKPQKVAKAWKGERPQKIEKPAKVERPERPERPEKPEKPEKPERPAKPEKPEKPERGPRR